MTEETSNKLMKNFKTKLNTQPKICLKQLRKIYINYVNFIV